MNDSRGDESEADEYSFKLAQDRFGHAKNMLKQAGNSTPSELNLFRVQYRSFTKGCRRQWKREHEIIP